MNRKLQSEVRKKVRKNQQKKRRYTILLVFGLLVAGGTAYFLSNPAATQQQATYCGFEEHTAHTDACYGKALVCGLSESGHTHTDACRTEERSLICTLPETDGHAHSSACYLSEKVLACGQEETEGHTHGSECFTTEQVLICQDTDPAHVHDDACYQETQTLSCSLSEVPAHHHDESCYQETQTLICEVPETPAHHHGDGCYETTTVYTCGLEESLPHTHTDACYAVDPAHPTCGRVLHTHTLQCFSNPYADLETEEVWKASFESVELSGDWNEDVLAIAKSQLGYPESTANYEVQPDGVTMKGYTRYGAWYGYPYGDWCAMFCSFCLNYAGVDRNLMPLEANCANWISLLEEKELYHTVSEDYTPVPGDLIFFDRDGNGISDHVGLISELGFGETEETSVDAADTLSDGTEAAAAETAGKDETVAGSEATAASAAAEGSGESAAEAADLTAETEASDEAAEEAESSAADTGDTSADEEENRDFKRIFSIEGNCFGTVRINDYKPDDMMIMGYGRLPEKPVETADGDESEAESEEALRTETAAEETSEEAVIEEVAKNLTSRPMMMASRPLLAAPAPSNAPVNVTFDNIWSLLPSSMYTLSGDDLTASPTSNDADTYLRAQISFSVDAADYEPGDIEIYLPYHVIPAREADENGNPWADTFSIALPEAPAVSTELMFNYEVDAANNRVIVRNSVPIHDQRQLNAIYSYRYTPSTVKDMTTGTITASYRICTDDGSGTKTWKDGSSSEELTYTINTCMDPAEVGKIYQTRYTTWRQDYWGDPPEGMNTADYCYISYKAYVIFNNVGGTQPGTFRIEENPASPGEVIAWNIEYLNNADNVGVHTRELDDYHTIALGHTADELAEEELSCFNDVIDPLNGLERVPDSYTITVICRYPASMAAVGNHFENSVTITQVPIDGIDSPQSDTAEVEYTWEQIQFSYSTGNSLYKYGDYRNDLDKTPLYTERTTGSYNHSAVEDTGAVTLLKNGMPAHLVYELVTNAEGYGVVYDAINHPETEPEMYPWKLVLIDDQVYLNNQPLYADDYYFNEINVENANHDVWKLDPNDGQYKRQMVSWGDGLTEMVTLWYRSIDAEGNLSDWQQTPHNIGKASGVKVPEGANQIKFEYNGDSIEFNLSVFVKLQINPTDHVKQIIGDAETAEVTNIAGMQVFDRNGVYVNPQLTSTISGFEDLKNMIIAHDQNGGYSVPANHCMYHKVQIEELDSLYFTGSLTKRVVTNSNDSENQRIVLQYEVKPTNNQLGFAIGIPDNDIAMKLYKDKEFLEAYTKEVKAKLNHTLEDLTYYDLLPPGMTVDPNSVKVDTPNNPANMITELEIVDNWRDTGRTMIIARADASNVAEGVVTKVYAGGASTNARLTVSVPARLTFTAYYGWDSLNDYGTTLHNVVALRNNNGDAIDIQSGYPDDPTSLSTSVMSAAEKAAFSDLNESGAADSCKNTLYTYCNTNLNYETAAVSGFSKSVKGENDAAFSAIGSTTTGGEYTYRLRLGTNKNQMAQDIIIYDIIENAYGSNAHWKGTFESVDVSQLRLKGVDPVVYYSTNANITIDTLSSTAADVTKTAYWSKTPPSDLSRVTAIAIDARYTNSATKAKFTLGSEDSISVMVKMRAPEDSEDLVDPLVYAYNQAKIRLTQKSNESGSSFGPSSLNNGTVVKVYIEDHFDLNIRKTDEDDGSVINRVQFKLADQDGNTVSEGYTGVNGTIRLTGLTINSAYVLTEVSAPAAYMPGGPWTVEVGADGGISLTDKNGDPIEPEDGFYPITNSKYKLELKLRKLDIKGKALEGAVFALYGTDDDGEILDMPMAGYEALVSDENGYLTADPIRLLPGTYYLREVKAPDGYYGINEPIRLVVQANADMKRVYCAPYTYGYGTTDGDVYCYEQDKPAVLSVRNTPGYALPESGGPGVIPFYAGGVMIFAGAAVCMIRRGRKQRNKAA